MSINIWNHLWQNSTVAHGGLCITYQAHVTSNCFSLFTEVVKKQQGDLAPENQWLEYVFLDNLIIVHFESMLCYTCMLAQIGKMLMF